MWLSATGTAEGTGSDRGCGCGVCDRLGNANRIGEPSANERRLGGIVANADRVGEGVPALFPSPDSNDESRECEPLRSLDAIVLNDKLARRASLVVADAAALLALDAPARRCGCTASIDRRGGRISDNAEPRPVVYCCCCCSSFLFFCGGGGVGLSTLVGSARRVIRSAGIASPRILVSLCSWRRRSSDSGTSSGVSGADGNIEAGETTWMAGTRSSDSTYAGSGADNGWAASHVELFSGSGAGDLIFFGG
ncbi:unnamed protein product [Mycena citricolor]|uniref:Uncharacterized protein n=1 Tax=Mycena citricolor TaxID=2018698 RepID=A0AAD2Q402_9AGAR|nr:unnamed protein product [Mycena citricolor]